MKFSSNRMLVGLIILVLGVMAFLSYFNSYFDFNVGQNIIPILLVVLGIYGVARGNSLVWSCGITFVGVWLIVNNILPGIPSELFWPGILIIIGIAFMLGAFGGHRFHFNGKDIDLSSMPDYFTAFGGLKVNNTSENFVSANASTAFGGIELDMRGAKIQGEEAVIDAFAAFGGIEIKVPTDWVVVTKGVPIFGGFDNKTVNNSAVIGKRLVVKGAAIFGGVSIKN